MVPLRSDARRNQELLTTAAVEVFRERGLDAPLEDIAQRAGVSPGTLYNRFGGRDALIDAVVPAMIQARIDEIIAAAEAIPDPWQAFTHYVGEVCGMQATDPALNDAMSRRYPDAEQLTAICDAQMDRARGLIAAARDAGALRDDFATEDLSYIFWSTSMIVRATTSTAPDTWRRALALTLDGLRAAAAHPLPVPPMTRPQVHEAMLGLSARRK